jgi:hypothetical protein
MAQFSKLVGRSISAALQIAAVLYLTLAMWLAVGWMAQDEWAASASTQDWWWAAAKRFGTGLFWAAVVGLVLWSLNRLLSRVGLTFSGAWSRAIAWASFGLIAVASAISAIQFAIDKPYM